MRKKNGFISMSIIYSFFAVFAIVSTTLLLVYSNNIAIVKNINKQIKEDLKKKGDDMLLVFDNLIPDGSIEKETPDWVNIGTGANYGDPLARKKEQQYYNESSLAMVYSDTTKFYSVRTKNKIKLKKDHYYYISRVYQSWNHTLGSMLSLYFMDSAGVNKYDILANAIGYSENISGSTNVYKTTTINRTRNRRESGWCVALNGNIDECKAGTYANTLESGIFKFNQPTGEYYLVAGANFDGWSSKTNPFKGLVNGNTTLELQGKDDTNCDNLCGAPPRYYTDGYMLFDLTVAFQLSNEKADEYIAGTGNARLACNARRIDNLLDARYYEGRKEFASHRINITIPC